jgi:hypothetical protein
LTKISIYMVLCLILAMGLLMSCGNTTSPEIPTPTKHSTPTVVPPPAEQPSASVNRVDIVYFYPKIRCAPCLSVELRTKDLVDSYFMEAVDSGKLTFQTYELQDKQNASIIKKYGAVGSQLFITTINNGNETIRHVEEVWMPQILNDGVAFDDFMQELISESLKEVS